MKRLALAPALALVFVGTQALAQPAPTPAPAAGPGAPAKPATAGAAKGTVPLAQALTGDAKSDYDTGRLLITNGDFAGALLKFQSAYDKSKDPRLLWNMAFCEKNLRHYSKVISLVRRYKDEGAQIISAKEAQDAEDLLWTLQSLTSTVKLVVNEPGATVTIDDEPVGTSPIEKPVLVDIGSRHIHATKDGFVPYDATITVGNAPETAVDVKLQKELHEGRLVVNAHSGDLISVDGKEMGTGHWEGTVPSGGHTLHVTAKGMRPYQQEVTLADKESRTVTVSLDPEAKEGVKIPTWAFIAGGAVLVSGAAVGGYFLFKPADQQADFQRGNVDPGFVEASRRFR